MIFLEGDLDSFTACEMRKALAPIDGEAVIDLRCVRLLSAAALTELVRVAKRAGAGAVVLIVTSPAVRQVLALVEFERLFRIVERLEEA
jgi:anti-anti-sigma factor